MHQVLCIIILLLLMIIRDIIANQQIFRSKMAQISLRHSLTFPSTQLEQ